MTPEQQPLADVIRGHLDTIAGAWADTATPMNHGTGSGSGTPALPSSTIVLRADIVLTLAYWVHALVDTFPVVLQHLDYRPIPTSDPNTLKPWALVVLTDTIDCTDVLAMCDLLDAEAERIAEEWEDYGQTLADELEPLANQARLVARPPRRDRLDLGPCPTCARSVLAKAVRWTRLPIPTSDPNTLPPWSPWQPAQDQLITCKGCGRRETLLGWRAAIVGTQRLLSADELVEEIHMWFGERYSPVTIRVWARRGFIQSRGYMRDGRAVYDRVQVFAALMSRETRGA